VSSSGHLATLPKGGKVATGWPADDAASRSTQVAYELTDARRPGERRQRARIAERVARLAGERSILRFGSIIEWTSPPTTVPSWLRSRLTSGALSAETRTTTETLLVGARTASSGAFLSMRTRSRVVRRSAGGDSAVLWQNRQVTGGRYGPRSRARHCIPTRFSCHTRRHCKIQLMGLRP
jgi:hypothetical protein